MDPALPAVASRCPSCNAALRPDAQWCSLCHRDLRPAPPPQPLVPASASHGPDPLTAPLLDLVLPAPAPAAVAPEAVVAAVPAPRHEAPTAWPCTTCGSSNPLDAVLCSACGSRFLAAASEPPSLVVPGVGDLRHLSRGQRLGLAGAFVAVVLVPLALVTFLLTEAPKQAPPGGRTTVTTVSP